MTTDKPARKDKQQVIDEVWTEQRVRDFLDVKPAEAVEADFHMLMKAYNAMRLADFELFVGFFIEDGRNINARYRHGRTALSYVREHRKSAGYAQALEQHGAEV